jgi:hypothetical protein
VGTKNVPTLPGWAHYELQLYEKLREERLTTDSSDGDPPF